MVNVYILILKDGRTYTGISKRPETRWMEHANGKSKSTKRFLPISLIHTVALENYKLARTLEVRIKGRGAKKFLSDSFFRRADLQLIKPGDKEFPTDKRNNRKRG